MDGSICMTLGLTIVILKWRIFCWSMEFQKLSTLGWFTNKLEEADTAKWDTREEEANLEIHMLFVSLFETFNFLLFKLLEHRDSLNTINYLDSAIVSATFIFIYCATGKRHGLFFTNRSTKRREKKSMKLSRKVNFRK